MLIYFQMSKLEINKYNVNFKLLHFFKVVNYDGICQAVPPSGSTVKYQVFHINFFVGFGETAHLKWCKLTKMHLSLIIYIT